MIPCDQRCDVVSDGDLTNGGCLKTVVELAHYSRPSCYDLLFGPVQSQDFGFLTRRVYMEACSALAFFHYTFDRG